MKGSYCLGVYMSSGYMEHTCFFRDDCRYYPSSTRWLADHWDDIDEYMRIKPPVMPPPPNLKSKDGGDVVCHCPFFLPVKIGYKNNEDKMRLFYNG